jgi:hypothetical protein
MAQCTARSKRSGQQCRKAAMHGRTVCYHHGGMSLIGAASRRFKHGRYSKVLPTRLAARYAESLANPTLLSLREDLAVCEARVADLLQRVDSGESGALWQQLRAVQEGFSQALVVRDVAQMRRQYTALEQLIEAGSADAATWQEIQHLWETRCRLTQAEVKLLVTQEQMVTTQQLLVCFGALTETIRTAVLAHTDQDTGRAILGDITAAFQAVSTLAEA